MIRSRLFLFPIALVAGACAHGGRPASAAPEHGAFVTRLGSDTVSVERYTRTRDSLVGDVVVRTPRTRVLHYVARLAPDGTITRVESSFRPVVEGQGMPRPQGATVVIGADSIRTTITMGDQAPRTIVTAAQPGAVPMLGAVWSLYEQGARQLRMARRDSVVVPLAFVGERELRMAPYVRVGADSMTIWYFGYLYRARVDDRGRLLGVNGLNTTNKVMVERVPDANIEQIAQRFAAADAGGHALGQLSPRDSVQATIGSAHIGVNYGRPSIRGRQLMGFLIPYDQVWRMGANAATGFTTDTDLLVNGVAVPAGSYTLWSITTREGTKLIVNRQTGQWGTEYDASRDLARIDMIHSTVAAPLEQFAIEVVPQGEGGVLQMTWGTQRFSVPITVAPKS